MAHHVNEDLRPPSFVEALQAAYPVLRDRLTRRFGDPQLAEEVGWDCLTHAYELWLARPGYFANRDLLAWTCQRAVWRALDRLRDRGRHTPLAEEHMGEELADAVAGPLLGVLDEEADRQRERDRQRTWDTLQKLDDLDRYILESYYYDDLTDQEIGDRLYGDETTEQGRGLRVWRRRKKAHARLKTLLIEGGMAPSEYAPLASQAV